MRFVLNNASPRVRDCMIYQRRRRRLASVKPHGIAITANDFNALIPFRHEQKGAVIEGIAIGVYCPMR